MFLGIDFGAKLAGTTTICFLYNKTLQITQSAKKSDADVFIAKTINELKPTKIYIDAPLSLPAVYFGKGNDYFFRKCDKETQAMSPMFLGGLTARAIKQKDSNPSIQFFEAYPGLNAKLNFPDLLNFYKSKNNMDLFLSGFLNKIPYPVQNKPENWHQVDSILAWLTGFRHSQDKAIYFGDEGEGFIWA